MLLYGTKELLTITKMYITIINILMLITSIVIAITIIIIVIFIITITAICDFVKPPLIHLPEKSIFIILIFILITCHQYYYCIC